MEYTFYIQDFWTTCACPEKQRVPWIHYIECVFYYSGFLSNLRCPEIFRCIEYIFYYSVVLSNLRLPWKQSCPGIFHCIEIYFVIQDFWGTCGCPENRVCPEIFQARGGGRPPASYAYDHQYTFSKPAWYRFVAQWLRTTVLRYAAR